MLKYISQRVLLAIPTVVLITILTFVGLRVFIPYDTVDIILEQYGGGDPQLQANMRHELGLSGSLTHQYLRWMGVEWFWGGDTGVLEGDLGKSLNNNRPVLTELEHRAPVSFELGLWAQLSSIMIAVPLGVWAAARQDKLPDYGLRSFAILMHSVPNFWIAVLVLTFGSIWFSYAPPIKFEYLWVNPIAHLKIMLLPALIIGITPSGGLLRLVRTQMLEVLRQDYVRTAQAKGLANSRVLYSHALRNALIPCRHGDRREPAEHHRRHRHLRGDLRHPRHGPVSHRRGEQPRLPRDPGSEPRLRDAAGGIGDHRRHQLRVPRSAYSVHVGLT